MHIEQAAAGLAGDMRPRTTYWIALTALLVVTPFTVNNFVHLRFGLAVASLVVVLVLVLNAWGARARRCGPGTVLATVVPPTVVFLAISTASQGVIGVLWCFPAVLSFYCMLPQRMAWAANAALLAVELPVMAATVESAVALRGAATLFGVSLFAAIQTRIIDGQQAQLSERVVTDPLTGLLNRHALVPTLERAIGRAAAEGVPAAIALVDLDRFKRVNDEHGHEVGDIVLQGLGALLRSRMRPGDAAFRIGGDEFLVVLHGADRAEAERWAEDARRAVRADGLLAGHALTASVGHAALCEGEGRREWVRRADSALYRAKAGGRDRAVGEPCDGAALVVAA